MDVATAHQIVVCGHRVQIDALFGRISLALAIPSLVEDEDIDAQIVKEPQILQAMRNVAGISVGP